MYLTVKRLSQEDYSKNTHRQKTIDVEASKVTASIFLLLRRADDLL